VSDGAATRLGGLCFREALANNIRCRGRCADSRRAEGARRTGATVATLAGPTFPGTTDTLTTNWRLQATSLVALKTPLARAAASAATVGSALSISAVGLANTIAVVALMLGSIADSAKAAAAIWATTPLGTGREADTLASSTLFLARAIAARTATCVITTPLFLALRDTSALTIKAGEPLVTLSATAPTTIGAAY
jgi:hypothetical protein